MKKENRKLKSALILQSFSPLFLLLFIKYAEWGLIGLFFKFWEELFHIGAGAFWSAIVHEKFLTLMLLLVSLCWILLSIAAGFLLKDAGTAGFIDSGEHIKINKITTDAGVLFYVTFVIPLVLDDLGAIRNFLIFMAIMIMLILLMCRTNLYYQNPVLTVLGLRTFEFEFRDTKDPELKDKNFVGITRGPLNEENIIKRQYISDDVFLIYNKNFHGGTDDGAKNST